MFFGLEASINQLFKSNIAAKCSKRVFVNNIENGCISELEKRHKRQEITSEYIFYVFKTFQSPLLTVFNYSEVL